MNGKDVKNDMNAPAMNCSERRKPVWRGVLHQWAFPVSLLAGAFLVWRAPSGTPRWAALVYAASLSALLGTSALYHRLNWSPRVRVWLGRLDVTMIFVLIAGSYTPVALLVMNGLLATITLAVVWAAVVVAAFVQLLRREWPKWATAAGCLAVGWVGVVAMPQIAVESGIVPLFLFIAGGVLYSAGAVVYALQRPDPRPAVFGYHEIFHAFVVVAAALHYTAIAGFVLTI